MIATKYEAVNIPLKDPEGEKNTACIHVYNTLVVISEHVEVPFRLWNTRHRH